MWHCQSLPLGCWCSSLTSPRSSECKAGQLGQSAQVGDLPWSRATLLPTQSVLYLVLIVEGFKLGIHKQDVLWLQVCVGQLILM